MLILRRMAIMIALISSQASLFTAVAQEFMWNTQPVRGIMPNSNQLASSVDNINSVYGNLHINMPLASLPPGRGGMSYAVGLSYDSNLYDITNDITIDYSYAPPRYIPIQHLGPNNDRAGWHYNDWYSLELEYKESNVVDLTASCNPQDARRYRYKIIMPDGSSHVLHLEGHGVHHGDNTYNGDGFYGVSPSGQLPSESYLGYLYTPECTIANNWQEMNPQSMRYYTSDGSYLRLEQLTDGWVLYFPDGHRVEETSNGSKLIDANGNSIRRIHGCDDDDPACDKPYIAYRDDLDREIRIYDGYTEAPLLREDRITTIGPYGNELKWTIHWALNSYGGDGRTVIMGKNYDFNTLYLENYGEYFRWEVKFIQLPLGPAKPLGESPDAWNSYEFGYWGNSVGGYGQLGYMRVPSGAEYKYEYIYDGQWPILASDLAHNSWVKKRTITADGGNIVWNYDFGGLNETISTSSTITNPDGGQTIYGFSKEGWNRGLVSTISRPDGSITVRYWDQNKVYDQWGGLSSNENNPYLSKETLIVSEEAQLKSSAIAYAYDKNGNVKSRTEYAERANYSGSGAPPDGYNPRITRYEYYVSVPDAASSEDNINVYWNASAPQRLNALKSQTISVGSNSESTSASYYVYDNALSKGNLVEERRWDSTKADTFPGVNNLTSSNSVILNWSYDAFGNITDVGASGNTSQVRKHYEYEAIGGFSNIYPTKIYTAFESAIQRIETQAWNIESGFLISSTDLDNGIQTLYDYDNVGRKIGITENNGGSLQRQTIIDYNDPARMVTETTPLDSNRSLSTTTYYDMLGRITRISQPNGAQIDRRYYWAAGGKYETVTNPYFTTSDSTMGWTCTQYDQLGRVTGVSSYSGSTEPSSCTQTTDLTGTTTTSYNGDEVTITDPALIIRKSTTDGLGRLIRVREGSSGPETIYSYDIKDNLVSVTQGSQIRIYEYDSLGRLKSANNPESELVSYIYDDRGNLRYKTDARGVVTEITYDDLNRALDKYYTPNTTPRVVWCYDGKSYSSGSCSGSRITGQIGKMTAVGARSLDGSFESYTMYSYDNLGRVRKSSQTTGGTPYVFGDFSNDGYAYNLANRLTQIQYPSGRKVVYSYNNAGQPQTVNSLGGQTYASSVSYNPQGAVSQMILGNGLVQSTVYNSRFQPISLSTGSLLTLGYTYDTGNRDNNGNVRCQTITVGTDIWAASYTYDSVNRLNTATETRNSTHTWSQTYNYDQYGNRGTTGYIINSTLTPQSTADYDDTTNRLKAWLGWQYDESGNLLVDKSNQSYAYDAENRQISFNGTAATYYYDGEGRRVMKADGGSTTIYVYDAMGQLAAEYSNQSPGVPEIRYITQDPLGSTRLVTDSSMVVLSRHDYLPFGEEIPGSVGSRSLVPGYSASELVAQRFTGKERDQETGLDFFDARYYSSPQGRFLSVDPGNAGASSSDPQSWNAYAYGRNNPLKYTDPDGMSYTLCDLNGNCIYDYSDEDFSQNFKHGSGIWLWPDGSGGGMIYADGVQIGYFSYNGFFFEEVQKRLADQADATEKLIGGLALSSVVMGVTGGTGMAIFSNGGMATLGLAGARILPLLPAVPGAITKLQRLGISLEKANEIISNPASQKLIDKLNSGNINVIQDIGGKLIRITLDPSGQRIISAGIVRANQITNGIASGRFVVK